MIRVMVATNVVTRAGRMHTTEAGDARLAALWLNVAARTQAGERILHLRDELQHLLKASGPGRGQYITLATSALNRALKDYLFSPFLMFDPQAGQWKYTQLPQSKRGPTAQFNEDGQNILIRESTVAAALVRLFVQGKLGLLHLCDQCQKVWHVAPRNIDRFCCSKCRDAWHAKSTDGLERRREIQRRYRQNLKRKIAAQDAALKGRK